MFAGSMLIGNSMPDEYNLLYFMIASPSIIFTYMGLNFFGFTGHISLRIYYEQLHSQPFSACMPGLCSYCEP